MRLFLVLSLVVVVFMILMTMCVVKKRKKLPSISILNLVLFSPGPDYDEMYKHTRRFYDTCKNVDTIYYFFDPSIQSPYAYDKLSKILRIRGRETYVPGILHKTVLAFQYVPQLGKKYDYIVRTNISTVVNFHVINEILTTNPVDLAGGRLSYLSREWRDIPAGIDNDRYQGLHYLTGTCILMSKSFFAKVMSLIHKIDYSVIDDVAIGQLVHMHLPTTKITNWQHLYFPSEELLDENGLKQVCDRFAIFRNKLENRKKDVINIKNISSYLTKKYERG